jgi:hypothetical protein
VATSCGYGESEFEDRDIQSSMPIAGVPPRRTVIPALLPRESSDRAVVAWHGGDLDRCKRPTARLNIWEEPMTGESASDSVLEGLRDALDDLEALLARLVANHSGARFEARMRGLASEMAEFQIERSTVADSLTYCDLITGPTGARISVEDRWANIRERYGVSHVAVLSLSRRRLGNGRPAQPGHPPSGLGRSTRLPPGIGLAPVAR